MENLTEDNIKYLEAKKKVKKMKGFYIHLIVYLLVNLLIIASNVQEGASITNMDNYWTAIFWGIGLVAHAASVFMPNFIFGSDWEERKTREIMNKNR